MRLFSEFIQESSVKELPLDTIMRKIKDGEWESEQDVVKGKLITISFGKGKPRKKMMVRVS